MALKWQDIIKYTSGGTVSLIAVIFLILQLSGMEYSTPSDIICGHDCLSQIQVNSTYWEVCAEHGGDKGIIYKKTVYGRRLWLNLDKVKNVITTDGEVDVNLYVPTVKKYATVNHDEYGYLRPIEDGDCFIKRQTKDRPQGSVFYIFGNKTDAFDDIKWSFSMDSVYSEKINIDPVWEGIGKYELITEEVAGRKYDPNAFSTLYIITNVTMNNDLSKLKSSDFSSYKKYQKGNIDIIDSGVDYLTKEKIFVTVPDYGICTDKNCTFVSKDNITQSEVCLPFNYSCEVSSHQEERYVDAWKKIPDNTKLNKGEPVTLCYWFKRKIDIGNFSLDVVPSIKGYDMPKLAWWDAGWSHKRQINITNPQGNYSILMNLTYNVHYNNTDCSDIRFVNMTENEELDYWVEVNTSANNCSVWIEDRQAGNFYLYYGNTTPLASTSNIANAFYYGIDWTKQTSLPSPWLNTSTVAYTFSSADGITLTFSGADSWTRGMYLNGVNFSAPIAVRTIDLNTSSDYGYSQGITSAPTSTNRLGGDGNEYKGQPASGWSMAKWVGGAYSAGSGGGTMSKNVLYTQESIYNKTNVQRLWVKGQNFVINRTDPSNASAYISYGAYFSTTVLKMKQTIVRNYAEPEPTYAISNEENPPPAEGIIITLFLNGTSSNSIYEYGEGINITGTADSGSVCLSVDLPEYGDNYTCGDKNVSLFLNAYTRQNKFNDSSYSKNLTANTTVYLQMDNKSIIINSAKLNLTGYNQTNYPTNIQIDIGNDGTMDKIFSGILSGNNFNLNSLNDSSTVKNFTFNSIGNQITYINLPRRINISSASMNLSGHERYNYENDILGISDGECCWTFNEHSFQIEYDNPDSINITNITFFANTAVNLNISTQSKNSSCSIPTYGESNCSINLQVNDDDIVTINWTYGMSNGLLKTSGGTYNYINNTWINQIGSDVILHMYAIRNYNISNPYLNIGNNQDKEWNYTGEFNQSVNPITISNITEINDYLWSSDCTRLTCDVPILVHSDSAGILQISNINISYNLNPIILNSTRMQEYLSTSVNVPIGINASGWGSITMNGLNISYKGSQNITVKAHTPDYATNDTQYLYVVFSNYSKSLPYTFIDNIMFAPTTNSSKRIVPYGQTNSTPIFNISWLNYDKKTDLGIKTNLTDSCMSLYASTSKDYISGMVGYWKFDQGSGSAAYDWTEYENDGALINMNTTGNSTSGWTTGYYGSGLLFDGVNDYINITDVGDFNLTELSISFWFNASTVSGVQVILDKKYQSSYTILLSSDTLQFFTNKSSSQFYPISADTWYHFTGTYNGTHHQLYINGDLEDTDAGTIGFDDNPIVIGMRYDGLGYFNGTIDEVRIFNRSLSAAEISSLYSRQIGNRINITGSYKRIYPSREVSSINQTNIWLWLDLANCQKSIWRNVSLDLKSCCVECSCW